MSPRPRGASHHARPTAHERARAAGSQTSEPRSTASRNALLWAALAIVTLAAYQPAWHGGPLWDDNAHLTAPALQSVDGLRRIWFELGATQQYYPIAHSAFWAMHHLWGDGTTGYHLVNILLHALSALFVALVLRRLSVPGAILAALVFALHPVEVESVAWMTELKNTLSTSFYLGAALCYLRFDETREQRHWVWSAVLFVLALGSKTVTATLPVSLLIVFWWKRGRLSWPRDVRPLIPFFLLALAGGAMTSWVEYSQIGAHGVEFQLTIVQRILLSGRAVWFYLASLVWPAHLVFIYPRWQISAAVWWQYLFPVALAATLAVLWHLRPRTRAPLAALLLFIVALGPALGFVNVYPFRYSFVADHFQYAASVPAIAFLAAALTRLAAQWVASPAVRAALALALLGPLAVLTWQNSHQYVDGETLFRSTIARNPSAWMAHIGLAAMRLSGAKPDPAQALVHLRDALGADPQSPEVQNTLGLFLQHEGRSGEARQAYEAAARLNPTFALPHSNLGALAYSEGRLEDAVRHYREAVRLEPKDLKLQRNLAIALLDLGRPQEAAQFQGALAEDANSPDALENLGSLALQQGRPDDAIARYEAALRLRPDSAVVRINLGIAFEMLGRLAEAEAQYREALRLEPGSARAHDNLGTLLLQQRHFADAVTHLTEAIRLRPDSAPAHVSLAAALQDLGRPDESIAAYRRALALPANAGSADVHNAYGVTLALRGRRAEAIVEFQEALRLNPDQPEARANLARAQGR